MSIFYQITKHRIQGRNACCSLFYFMIGLFKNLYRMSVHTKFVSYTPGPAENLFIDQRELKVEEGELLIKVKAVGINRAECLHRAGKYKIGKPNQAFIGLEASGEVYDPIKQQKLFDGIALLSGGSYAEWASVPAKHIMPLPKGLNYVEGAAIPQAWLTAFQLLRLAEVKAGHKVVMYAGASGVGTAAIQLGKLLGASVYCVVSTPEKGEICKNLGAAGVVFYKNNPTWAKELLAQSGPFNTVLDCVGSDNYESTIELLDIDGKWVLFGLLSGSKTNLNLASLLAKRIVLISTTLKTRSDAYKTNLIEDFTKTALWAFDQKKLSPIIYQTIKSQWSNASAFIEAHKLMESNQNSGKIMIQMI